MYHFPKASFRQSSLKLGLLAFAAAISSGQSPNVAAQPGVLEEVLVVATRRESSLQDVSVAVSAVSESMLIDNQIYSSAELTDLVPSLTLQQGGNARGSSFNVRGVGTQSFSSAAEPSVSTMVDGVVMGRSGMAFAQLPDVQRVEVLRGPQGTLFGKNASAGVVHVITKNPTAEHEGEFSASALEKDEYRLAGTASGPLTDNLG
jgi:iron complex outermembrane receptor protein